MSERQPSRPRPLAWLAVHALVLVALLAWGLTRYRALGAARVLPPVRAEPLALVSLHDDATVVGDEELARVLARVRLRAAPGGNRIADLEHGLRLRGRDDREAEPGFLSGWDMLRILLDSSSFTAVYGPEVAPLLFAAPAGIGVRVGAGRGSSTHYDHLLSVLGEVGLPAAYPVHPPAGPRSVRSLLEFSLASSSLNQDEYEWTALAYALYLPPVASWRSREGQEVTFDRLARRILRAPVPDGVCSGNHRFYALAALLQLDARLAHAGEAALLEPATRERVEAFLTGVSARFAASQAADGAWGLDWALGGGPEVAGDRGDRLLVTGHALEWWALVPAALQPPRPAVRRAAAWLVANITGLEEAEVHESYSFLTHAASGLALWRGRPPGGAAREP